MNTLVTSKQFSLNINDFLKGLLMAVGTPVIAILISSLQSGSFNFDWKMIGTVALSSALVYLSKNFFTPSAIVVKDASDKQVEAVKDGTAEVTVTPPQ
jgi:membrane protein implicated in regulation of membrane protease activity